MTPTKTMSRAAALAVAGGAAYALARWPRMSTWGATVQEAIEVLPGDEVITEPKYRTTHAVSIDAPPERVWAWLVQLGQGRGGMYSYDWLENLVGLRMHSAQRIIPELQELRVGDTIRMVPEGTQPDLSFVVARVEPPHLLVLGPAAPREESMESGYPYPVWTFVVRPEGERGSRLVVRFSSDFKPTPTGWLSNKYALEPVHFVMERKMLLTLKDRAEHVAA